MPHYLSGGGFVTKLTIVNLAATQNNVTVNFIAQDGSLISSTSYLLGPRATQRIETSEAQRFQSPTATSWAVIGSDLDVGVNTFFELSNTVLPNVINTIGFNDAVPATSQQLPVEFEPKPANAPIGRTVGLALANTSTSPGSAVLSLLNSAGIVLATTTVSLGALGQTAIDLSNLPAFSAVLPAANFVGQVSISSTTPMAAIALGDDLGPFFGTPPIASGRSGQLIIPHIVNGGGYITKLTFMNLSGLSNVLDVKYFDQQGNLQQQQAVILGPRGTARTSAPESARFLTSTTSWALVTAPQPAAVNLFFEIEDSSGAVINTIGFNDSPAVSSFTIPVEFQPTPQGAPIGRTVGLAFANAGPVSAAGTLQLLNSAGAVLATANPGTLISQHQTAFNLTTVPEFAAALPASDFVGTVRAVLDNPVSAIALGDDYGPFYATPIMLSSPGVVTPPTLQAITLTPLGPIAQRASTLQFLAIGSYSDGTIRDLTATAAWSSSSAAAATISATGLATTVNVGQTTIQAAVGGVSSSTVLTVITNGVVSVSVAPASAIMPVGGTQQFTASVQGLGTFNTAVSWTVNDVAGGDFVVGRISTSGLYTAPAGIPNSNIITVKAISAVDPTKSGSATVVLGAAVISGSVFGGGVLTNALVRVFGVNPNTGDTGLQLGSASTDSAGNFKVALASIPPVPIVVTATGGTYISVADGTQRIGTVPLSAFVDAVTTPTITGVAVTPLTDFVAQVTRQRLLKGGLASSFAEAHTQANAIVSALYGLGPSTILETLLPKFAKGDITANPKNFAAGLVISSLAVQGRSMVPAKPDALVGALSNDFDDGALDGKGSGPIPLGNGVLPSTAGTTDFLLSVNGCVASCNAIKTAGVVPADLPGVTSSVAMGVQSSILTPKGFGLTAGSSAALATLSFGGRQYVFIAGRTKGIVVLDVTDPAHIPTPKAWTYLSNVTFQQNFVGGVVPVVGTATHAQVLAYAFALPHIALINAEVLATGTPGIDDNRLVDFETNLTLTHNPPVFSEISPLIAGGIADNGRKGVWLTTADGYAFFDLNTNIVTNIYPALAGQELAENLGGDILHNVLLAGNYVGMQLIDLAKQKSYGMDVLFFANNIATLAASKFVDANSVDNGFQVGIGTAEHTSTPFFINLTNLGTNDATLIFAPAPGAFVSVPLAPANQLDLTGPAADSTSHLVLFSGDNSPDVAVGVLQDPASVPLGSWTGLTDWVFYNIINSPTLSTYFGSSDPHVFGTVFNVGVAKPFGYLLDSTDTFVVQLDMQGLLNLERLGPSGTAAHRPGVDPATSGVLSAIAIP